MCNTEIATRGILTAFLQEILKIYNPTLATLQAELNTNSEKLPENLTSDVQILQKIIIVVGHVCLYFF